MHTDTATLSQQRSRTDSGAPSITAQTVYDWAALIGRIGLAAIFLWSGYGKLAHMDFNIGYMNAYGVTLPELTIWPALLVELIGGAMLVVGWKARWAALVLAAFTAVATLIFHAYWAVPADQALMQQIQFMKNLAMLGGLLGVFAHGAGRVALER
jgi:putative oxidoreductase